MYLKTLFRKMTGRGYFNAVERAVLEAVRRELPDALTVKFEAQVKAINKVQRFAEGREVNLYHLRRGKPCPDQRYMFLKAEGDLLLARVSIVDEQHQMTEGKVWVVCGQIFSLTFTRSPRHLKGVVQVSSVSLFPRLGLPLPDDYEDFSKASSPADARGWTVLDPGQMRETVLDDGNYYTIAEHPDFGVLAVRESDVKPQLYFLRFENSRVIACGATLQEALQHVADETAKGDMTDSTA